MSLRPQKLVIANRGEIARRILKTARAKGYEVAVITTADSTDTLVCQEADQILEVPHFLDAAAIVSQCVAYKADLLHPGYGFLSENADFAQQVEEAGIRFVGPTSANMTCMGGKESSKAIAKRCQVPTLEALLSAELKAMEPSQWAQALHARGIEAPYLVKASGGGGGRGMRVVAESAHLPQALQRASEEALASFGDATVFIERYVQTPRHIEIQVFGDGEGGGVFWGERECSLQRRHQKVFEEAPSSYIDGDLRAAMGKAALRLVTETHYRGAGTVEFLVDTQKQFYFLEMNTRLQVEHPVTELVYGIDLVDAQFELACGRWPQSFPEPSEFHIPEPRGYAFEARILAEDPRHQFLPTPGPLLFYQEPQGPGVRVDSGVRTGDSIDPRYDSLIAKLIVHAPTRPLATQYMIKALEEFPILGLITNQFFLKNILLHRDFVQGVEWTHWIEHCGESLTKSCLTKEDLSCLQDPGLQESLARALDDCRTATAVESLFRRQHALSANPQKPFSLTPEPLPVAGVLRFIVAGLNAPLYATRSTEDQIFLFYCGEQVRFPCPRRKIYTVQVPDGLAQGQLMAPMPGKLVALLVQEGDTVQEQQVVCVVESMKIQIEIKSPLKGIVKKIYKKQGQSLSNSDIIVEIEEQKGDHCHVELS